MHLDTMRNRPKGSEMSAQPLRNMMVRIFDLHEEIETLREQGRHHEVARLEMRLRTLIDEVSYRTPDPAPAVVPTRVAVSA